MSSLCIFENSNIDGDTINTELKSYKELQKANVDFHRGRRYMRGLRRQKQQQEEWLVKALDLFESILQIRTKYQNEAPYICIVDIATVHIEIANVLRLLEKYDQVSYHYHQAWAYYIEFYGFDHELTNEMKERWIVSMNKAKAETQTLVQIHEHGGVTATAPAA